MTTKLRRATGDPVGSVLALSAAYRHSILNHLQVLSGWLQLGQPQRAAEHILILTESMQAETQLVRAARPEAAALLIMRRGSADACGIEIEYEVDESIRGFGWPDAVPDAFIAGVIDAAILLLDAAPGGERIRIALGEEDARRTLVLRLMNAWVTREGLLETLQRILCEHPSPVGLPALLQRVEAAGGAWHCRQEGPVGVVTISWPGAD